MSDGEQLLRLEKAAERVAVRGGSHHLRAPSSGRLFRPSGHPGSAPARRQPDFLADIVISSGSDLKDRLLEQGLSPPR